MILQSIKMALKSLRANKLRSFLTMLGIIIGVFSLVVLVSLVAGATNTITDSINSMGIDKLNVSVFDNEGIYKEFTASEVISLPDKLPSVKAAAPEISVPMAVSSKTRSKGASVRGTTNSYSLINGTKMKYGRFIMEPDCINKTNVAVMDADTAVYFYGREDCIGENIKLGGRDFTVVGVTGGDGESVNMLSMLMGGGVFQIYIPYTSMTRFASSGGEGISSFCVAANAGDVDAAKKELNSYMMKRYDNNDEVFFIMSSSEISEAMDKITSTLSLLLGGIAAISLLVGGIGIMNIMLVSVTERTREIGIRKAIGARPGVIRLQFLIEAITLSIVGCLVGIGLSWVGVEVINIIGNVDFGLSVKAILVSVLFSSGVGILFGLYPAHKASKMKPIDALRFS